MSTHNPVRASWNQVAKPWATNMRSLFDRNDFVWGPFVAESQLKILPEVKGKEVLIAGCGSGADIQYFLKRGATVTGLDISEEQLALAAKRLKKQKRSAKLLQTDLDRLKRAKLPKASFDLIVSSYALQYVRDLKKFCQTSFDLLKPGGILAFSLDHPILYAHYPSVQGKERNRDASIFFDYLKERPLSWMFNLPDVAVKAKTYHRTVQSIIEAIISAGFVLERCVEPLPELSGIKHYRGLQAFAKRVPYTLILRARKPL